MVTVGVKSGNIQKGKKCQQTQSGQAFQSLDKNYISFISFISFIEALAAGLTPPPCLNIMGLKNKKYTIYPMWEQEKGEKKHGAIQKHSGELKAA